MLRRILVEIIINISCCDILCWFCVVFDFLMLGSKNKHKYFNTILSPSYSLKILFLTSHYGQVLVDMFLAHFLVVTSEGIKIVAQVIFPLNIKW